jgi:hypothetical protein
LQNAQADVELVKDVWPEVGDVMGELLKRRAGDEGGILDTSDEI